MKVGLVVVEFWEKLPKPNVLLLKVILPWLRPLKMFWLSQNLGFLVSLQISFSLFLLPIKLKIQCYRFCIKILSNSYARLCNLLLNQICEENMKVVETWRRLIFWTKAHYYKYINIGFAAKAQINELKKNDTFSNTK